MAQHLYTAHDRARVVKIVSPSDRQERYRTEWRRDYARLIHSAAFRRLQGKTQLFPSGESDFFRNRLTHSLEVAQIAKSIAIKINNTHPYFKKNNIDTDLVETAALAHDLGHPPFGHNGEAALNDCMWHAGGFEGNAQTLRVLAKLEKRQTKVTRDPDVHEPVLDGRDNRAGLNLTYRTLASVLKYDRQIPHLAERQGHVATVTKGYYYTEADLVEQIKQHVGADPRREFKTIECWIMDIADDIAYSTYDIEDSFKAGFLTPLNMWTASDDLKHKIAETVKDRLDKFYPDYSKEVRTFDIQDVYRTLVGIFKRVFDMGDDHAIAEIAQEYSANESAAIITHQVATTSDNTTQIGFYRTRFTSDLVGEFIRSVRVRFNKEYPALSKALLDIESFKTVEVLKNFAYQSLIMSPRLKVAEHRGKDIVKQIFKALEEDEGYLLMPADFQQLYSELADPSEKRRVICDFIAGMTDRYAIQFYGRLFGTNPESIYSQL